MTEHAFSEETSRHHNNFRHYPCIHCGAFKRVDSPGGWVGAYAVGVDAEKFPTCEAAREEMAREEEASKQRELERQQANAERRVALREFRTKYPQVGFYWVRCRDRGVTIAEMRVVAAGDDEEVRWWFMPGNDEDSPHVLDFGGVDVLSGPIVRFDPDATVQP